MDVVSSVEPTPVVFVGVATYDAIAVVPRLPQADERMVAQDLVLAGGGPAATAAVAAARLGVPAAFVGAVGDDEEGEHILAGLVAEGVDVSGVERLDGTRSGASVVLVDVSQGARAICTRPQPRLVIPPDSRGAELVEGASWVHVDHLGWRAVADLIGSARQDTSTRPRLSVDAGNPIPGFEACDVDLYVPTVEALRAVHGELPVAELLDAALANGARAVVATRGGEGSVAATADGRRHVIPAVPVEVVSTLGAGDVFHGALVAAVARGTEVAQSAAFAGAVAALSCRGVDGRSAIPDAATAAELVPTPSDRTSGGNL